MATEVVRRPTVIPRHMDSNGWWEILPPPCPPRVLDRRLRVRTAVVGGGICGVSAANRLGELCPGDEICLLEAERVGFGASGRSAGFMLDLHSHGMPKHPDILRRNMKIWDEGLASLRRKVREFQIQCDWVEAGRYYAAAGPDGELRLSQIVRTLDLHGVAYRLEDRSGLRTRLGTAFYSSGLFAEGNALVNPSALMRGLAKNLPSNVVVYEESPVIDLSRSGDVYRLQTPKSQVVADRVVLAAGVFLRQFGIAPAHFVPMATFASLTTPLDGQLLESLGTGAEFGLLASSEYGSTIRLTRGKRLFVRNHFSFEPGEPASRSRVDEIARMHRKSMAVRWPALSAVPFDYSWGGIMAFTRNDGAVFGRFAPNLYAVLTNDVSPTTRGEASGAALAEYMEGMDSDLLSTLLSMPSARRLPPRPILDLGIGLRRAWLKLVAGKEF